MIKGFFIIIFLKFLAILDIIFAEKLELYIWNKKGDSKSITKIWKKEIYKAYKK